MTTQSELKRKSLKISNEIIQGTSPCIFKKNTDPFIGSVCDHYGLISFNHIREVYILSFPSLITQYHAGD